MMQGKMLSCLCVGLIMTSMTRGQSYHPEKSLLQFMLDLHNTEVRVVGDSENIMFSPISIVTTLNLLLLGSNGNTESQLRSLLHYPTALKQTTIHSLFNDAVKRLLTPNRGVTMEMANGLFLDRQFDVLSGYLDLARAEYNASVETLDFRGNERASRQRVNDFISDKTRGRIRDMITFPLDNVDLLIANAVYFKGAWDAPFNRAATSQDDFFVSDSEVIKVNMMSNFRTLPWVEDKSLGVSMVGIPYEGQPAHFGFFVLLPDAPGVAGLKQLESQLTGEKLTNLINRMQLESVNLNIPRMSLEGSMDLKKTLITRGLTDIFDASSADLSRISNTRGLHVDAALHRANIVVNEEGSELAAATVVTNTRIRASKSLRANRPFLFFIRDNLSGVPVFWAKIVRPKE